MGPGNTYCGRNEAFETYRNSSISECSLSFPDLLDINGTSSGTLLASGNNGVLLHSSDGIEWTAYNDTIEGFAVNGKKILR